MLRAMRLETTGKLHAIFDTEQKTERFRLREFVIELGDNPSYPQLVKFQLTGDRCENLDGFEAGEEVRLEFSLRGREWTSPQGDVRYFNSLDVWKLDRTGASTQASEGFGAAPSNDIPPPSDDDIPF